MSEWTRLTPGKQNKVSIRVYRRINEGYPRRLRHLIGTGYQRGLALSVRRSVRLTDAELLALATVTEVWREVDEVQALVAEGEIELRGAGQHLAAYLEWVNEGGELDPDILEIYTERVERLGTALAPFEESADAT